MITFWLVAAAMTGVVLILILPSFLKTHVHTHIDQYSQNVTIARDRLRDLDASRNTGTISVEDYEAARSELEQSLALDLAALESAHNKSPNDNSTRFTAATLVVPILIAFTVPVVAGGLYLLVGEPAALESVNGLRNEVTATDAGTSPSIESMLDQLKTRLEQNPDDVRGWNILARTSMQLERYDDAARALKRLNSLMPNDPDILVQYADALAMLEGGVLEGKPIELINQALTVDPNQPQALWLAGMAADRRGDYPVAMTLWQRLLPQLDQDPQSRSELMSMIQDLKRRADEAGIDLSSLPINPETSATDAAGTTKTIAVENKGEVVASTSGGRAVNGSSLTVRVSLAEGLKTEARPDDTVFVFARAVGGPPMPIAAARKKVSDLPFKLVLDDTSAMIPSMSLSSFDTVNVVARISRSGQPIAASGDLEGMIENVKPAQSSELNIEIARKIP
ncbi:MAG: cytochrome c-type biogenesis protein CycH [marine bacterium B5-7]|nr:MAG: cytochrome c-type biogenesis protein CycH [marine bacterium B5-7]